MKARTTDVPGIYLKLRKTSRWITTGERGKRYLYITIKPGGEVGKSKSALKNKAWKLFSEYIRRKSGEYTACYTCGKVLHWKELQAGHLLDSRCNSILFEEEGVRVQCRGCNLFKSGNKEVYIPKFIDECGREKYDELVRLKHTSKKMSAGDYEELIEKYKAKLEAL